MQAPVRFVLVGIAAIPFAAVTPVHAQTELELLIKPWKTDPHLAETFDDPFYILSGEDSKSGEDIQIFDWDSIGRIKFDAQDADPDLWLGYRLLAINIERDIPGFPTGLTDLSLAVAAPLSDSNSEWNIGLIAGVGTANDNHFSNSDAQYGIGVLDLAKSLDVESVLHVGIDYHGNRALLPDVPLPYIMLENRISGDFKYRLGLPYTGFDWNPADALSLSAEYSFPANLQASATIKFSDDLGAFVDYKHRIDGFWREDSQTRRVFYEISRADIGVRWFKSPIGDVSVGIGYAFDQEFWRGWDIRELDSIATPTDEMLFFLTLRGTF